MKMKRTTLFLLRVEVWTTMFSLIYNVRWGLDGRAHRIENYEWEGQYNTSFGNSGFKSQMSTLFVKCG